MCQRRIENPTTAKMSMVELLEELRMMAVGNIDVLRQRQLLYKMHQLPGEPVCEFLERLHCLGELRELEVVLKEDMKKGEKLPYLEWSLRDCLVCGLEDHEIQKN